MKKFLAFVVLLVFGVGLFFVFKSKNSTPKNPPTANATAEDPAKNIQTQAPAAASTIAAASTAESLTANSPGNSAAGNTSSTTPPTTTELQDLPPQTVLDNARVALHNYNAAFGENPVGDNSEITAALMGKNPRQANFITAESGLRVNDKGEMIDAWGTPFFFHQLSGQMMEIRSAGEDRKMWTRDDLVTR